MTVNEASELQLIAGALQDISEICKDKNVSEKIKETQIKLEKIITDANTTNKGTY